MKKQPDHIQNDFKVEVVEFYPNKNEKKKMFGTLHVYLPDLDIDLRGCPVYKTKKTFIAEPPFLFGVHEDTQEACRFPIFNFCNSKTQAKFYDAFKKATLQYMFKKFSKKPFKRKNKCLKKS